MNIPIKRLLIVVALCAAAIAGVVLMFLENIRGYYKFEEICKDKAGMKVHQLLERKAGWLVKGGQIEHAAVILEFEQVAFVRYLNKKDGNWYDVYKVAKQKPGDAGYEQRRSNLEIPTTYEYLAEIKVLEGELRVGAIIEKFIDLRTGDVAATYSQFNYSKFNPDNTLFSTSSAEYCPDDPFLTDELTGKPLPLKREQAISSIFKN